jgi:hypothetical protein
MEESAVKGSCLCGEVAYEIVPPFLFFQYCHCSRCRKSSGSLHGANLFMKRDQFRWTRGEAVVKRYELPGAQYFCTGFCPICGSPMPWVSRNGKYVLVPAGTLDDDPGVTPQRSIFWESRAPWYVEVGSLPTFADEA